MQDHFSDSAQQMYGLMRELFPICRSITGDGVRRTLQRIGQEIPLTFKSYPSGMKCFDWEIPDEWNIRSAVIRDSNGRTIVDFKNNNLHVVSYSEPIDGLFSLDQLKSHIFTIPAKPSVIPYITSYYKKQWGFCMSHDNFLSMSDGIYHVTIDADLAPGELNIAEAIIPGRSAKEVLLSSYICHPSMANDALSGVVLTVQLYKELSKQGDNYYGYRFLFLPETIGSIVYLYDHKDIIKERLHSGLVVTCVGDKGRFNYKRSRRGASTIDRVVENVLKNSGYKYQIRDFWPDGGSDERQYCSPGFNLPIGSLMRSVYGEFEEYHTSLDNLDFIDQQSLLESLNLYLMVMEALQINASYLNTNPFCEPQLSKRGLYHAWGAVKEKSEQIKKMMWLLNYSDGEHELVDISDRMGFGILDMKESLGHLMNASLLERKE